MATATSYIWARSPFWYKIKNTNLTSLELEIKIYTGAKNAVWAGSPDYKLTATSIPDGTDAVVKINVSPMILDFFKSEMNDGVYRQDADQYGCIWVDFRYTEYISAVAQPSVDDLGYLAFNGYLNFKDGTQSNITNPFNDKTGILFSNRKIIKPMDEEINLPINPQYVEEITMFSNGDQMFHSSPTTPTDSWEHIEYFNVSDNIGNFQARVLNDGGIWEASGCSRALDSEEATYPIDNILIQVKDVVTKIEVENVCERKYTPYKIIYLNRYGALQDLWMFKRKDEALKVKKSTFKRNILEVWNNEDFSITAHQTDVLDVNGVTSVILNSGFYPEENNELFRQLLLSPKVWIMLNNEADGVGLYPVTLTSSNITYKTHLNNKLIEYALGFEYSFSAIQNIR